MEKHHFYFVFGALQLLGCSFLTLEATNTTNTVSPTPSSTLSDELATISSSVNVSLEISPNSSCSTVVPCSNATVNGSSSCSVVVSCFVSPTTTKFVLPTSAVIVPATSPPKTTSARLKVTLDIPFKEEYRDIESEGYIELVQNLTKVLEPTFRSLEGFLGVDILSLSKGSVICDFDFIFNETASTKPEDVKKILQEASKNGLGGYTVKNIETEGEKKDEDEKDALPMWAMVTLILLGALGLVLLITVIILAVLLRRTKDSSPPYSVSGEDWSHYESRSMGDYKTRAGVPERGRLRNGDNNQPGYENHPTSHSNLTYQVPSNGE